MEVIRTQAAFAKRKGLFKKASAKRVITSFLACGCLSGSSDQNEVTEVDIFVSHSWSCQSWMKSFALCHHLNLNTAILMSNLAAILAALILLVHSGSVSAVAREYQHSWLFTALMLFPLLVFLVIFFFGSLAVPLPFLWI